MSRSRRWVVLVLTAAGSLAGCGKAEQPWETVHPAKGVVNYRGKPLAGAVITLIPQDATFPSSVRPTATSKEDGAFELGTYSVADGAPVGDYKALVLHFPVVGKKSNPSAGPNDLPRKYAAESTTNLVVKIAEGATEPLSLELK